MTEEADRSDGLAILTDDELKGALLRRRAMLRERLADIQVDKLMPDWSRVSPAAQEATEQSIALLLAALEDIERRLKAASEVLRSIG